MHVMDYKYMKYIAPILFNCGIAVLLILGFKFEIHLFLSIAIVFCGISIFPLSYWLALKCLYSKRWIVITCISTYTTIIVLSLLFYNLI